MTQKHPTPTIGPPRHGIARILSKLGVGSRTQSARWVRDGRVRVNGRVVRDPEFPVRQGTDRVLFDDRDPSSPRAIIMLNKPRGLVTTARDEQGRDTVYSCLQDADLPWMAPVGRLDKASEGLLLFTNDPLWAAGITQPASALDKTYHVQINRRPDAGLLAAMERGVELDGEHLGTKSVRCLRGGERNAWLEIVLQEGRNRQIRRLLAALDVAVLRLVRVGIGSLSLGDLAKGRWRRLSQREIDTITRVHPTASPEIPPSAPTF